MKAKEYDMNDELLAKYLLGEAGSEERAAVIQWINASPENSKYFEHFQLIWNTSKHLLVPSRTTADAAWQRFQERTTSSKNRGRIVKTGFSVSLLRVASILILVSTIVVFFYIFSERSTGRLITIVANARAVSDTLPDGSIVMLNKNSNISYAGTFKNKRNIHLNGEGFFTVTPDKQKPFVVTINNITVTVVGTSFNVKSKNGNIEVLVETGTVRVRMNNNSIDLRPNEKLVTTAGDRTLTKERVTDRLHQYYRSKEFACDNTPLWKLVEVLNEAYSSKIVFARDELRRLPLTTVFYDEPLDNILSVIAETFDISIEKKGDQIILK